VSLGEQTQLLTSLLQLFEEHPSASDMSPPLLADDVGAREVARLYHAYPNMSGAHQMLQQLHKHAPAVGIPPTEGDLLRMERRDAATRVLTRMGAPSDSVAVLAAAAAAAVTATAAATLAITPLIDAALPRVRLEKLVLRASQTFADCKNAWRRAFHPDKNQCAAWDQTNQQSSQVLDAWKTLDERYQMFRELHEAHVRLEAVRWVPKPPRSGSLPAGSLDMVDLSDEPSDPTPALQQQEAGRADELD